MDDNSQKQQPLTKSPTELLTAQTQSLSELVEIQKKQIVQITELKNQNERMIKFLTDRFRSNPYESEKSVTIEDINIPFGSLVYLIIKISFAAIPAAIILGIIYALVGVILSGFLRF
jgi:hypothetical protein